MLGVAERFGFSLLIGVFEFYRVLCFSRFSEVFRSVSLGTHCISDSQPVGREVIFNYRHLFILFIKLEL